MLSMDEQEAVLSELLKGAKEELSTAHEALVDMALELSAAKRDLVSARAQIRELYVYKGRVLTLEEGMERLRDEKTELETRVARHVGNQQIVAVAIAPVVAENVFETARPILGSGCPRWRELEEGKRQSLTQAAVEGFLAELSRR